jgi:thiamine pyrophosphate-dependent enzyme
MLAATWGDISGSPGIYLSTRGPGAANLVNGVAHAFLDRSPRINNLPTPIATDLRNRPRRARLKSLLVVRPRACREMPLACLRAQAISQSSVAPNGPIKSARLGIVGKGGLCQAPRPSLTHSDF